MTMKQMLWFAVFLLAIAAGALAVNKWQGGDQDSDQHTKVIGWCVDQVIENMQRTGLPDEYIASDVPQIVVECEADWQEYSDRWDAE
jgi:hypothetical protein